MSPWSCTPSCSPATSAHSGETPLRVEVTGPLLTIDDEPLLGLSTEDITPLEDGPRVILAERFAPETPGLAGECPDGTAQVVQLTWEGA